MHDLSISIGHSGVVEAACYAGAVGIAVVDSTMTQLGRVCIHSLSHDTSAKRLAAFCKFNEREKPCVNRALYKVLPQPR